MTKPLTIAARRNFADKGVLHSYHGYQDTETPISPIAQKVHGITKDLLEGQEFNRKLIRTHFNR